MKTQYYLAGPYAARQELRHICDELDEDGATFCTSTWLDSNRVICPSTIGASEASSDEDVRKHAQGDLADVDRADVFVMATAGYLQARDPNLRGSQLHTGGRQVELGYAIAREKPVFVLCRKPENIFQRAFGELVGNTYYLSKLLRSYEKPD